MPRGSDPKHLAPRLVSRTSYGETSGSAAKHRDGACARCRLGIGGFWRLLQQEFGELFGGVGEGEALAGPVVELVGDGIEL